MAVGRSEGGSKRLSLGDQENSIYSGSPDQWLGTYCALHKSVGMEGLGDSAHWAGGKSECDLLSTECLECHWIPEEN